MQSQEPPFPYGVPSQVQPENQEWPNYTYSSDSTDFVSQPNGLPSRNSSYNVPESVQERAKATNDNLGSRALLSSSGLDQETWNNYLRPFITQFSDDADRTQLHEQPSTSGQGDISAGENSNESLLSSRALAYVNGEAPFALFNLQTNTQQTDQRSPVPFEGVPATENTARPSETSSDSQSSFYLYDHSVKRKGRSRRLQDRRRTPRPGTNTHGGYICEVCKRPFRRKDDLKRHQRTFHRADVVYISMGVNVLNLSSDKRAFTRKDKCNDTLKDKRHQVPNDRLNFLTVPDCARALIWRCPLCRESADAPLFLWDHFLKHMSDHYQNGCFLPPGFSERCWCQLSPSNFSGIMAKYGITKCVKCSNDLQPMTQCARNGLICNTCEEDISSRLEIFQNKVREQITALSTSTTTSSDVEGMTATTATSPAFLYTSTSQPESSSLGFDKNPSADLFDNESDLLSQMSDDQLLNGPNPYRSIHYMDAFS